MYIFSNLYKYISGFWRNSKLICSRCKINYESNNSQYSYNNERFCSIKCLMLKCSEPYI